MRSRKLLRFVLFGAAIPFWLFFFSRYGFVTNATFTPTLQSEQAFREHYEHGIYRYRVLGRKLLLVFHHALRSSKARFFRAPYPVRDPNSYENNAFNGRFEFYNSYFLYDAIFLLLTCGGLFLILNHKAFFRTESLADAQLTLIVCLVMLCQFVVVPYDIISYVFLVFAFWLIACRDRRSLLEVGLLCALTIAATLTRETAVLIPTIYFSFSVTRRRFGRREVAVFGLLSICFAATYGGLRWYYGGGPTAFYQMLGRLGDGLIEKFCLAFWITSIVALLIDRSNRRASWIFLLAALPYAVMVGLLGSHLEVRLWSPLLVLLILIKCIKPRYLEPHGHFSQNAVPEAENLNI